MPRRALQATSLDVSCSVAILVDTALTELHPAVADMDPQLEPLTEQSLRGVRLLRAPGHTPGSQIVVVDTPQGLAAIVGDTAVWSR